MIKIKTEGETSQKNEYDALRDKLSWVNFGLAKCIDNRYVDELPEVIIRLKGILEGVDGRYLELLKRPLNLLHAVLITRMYYNKTFKSPLYQYNLDEMRVGANSLIELRNLYAIYIYAIEESIVQEA